MTRLAPLLRERRRRAKTAIGDSGASILAACNGARAPKVFPEHGAACGFRWSAALSTWGVPPTGDGSCVVDRVERHNTSDPLGALRARWQARRDEFARFDATVHGARLCDEILADLDTALRAIGGELLTLHEAAAMSGYSADHLGRLVRAGKLLNAGRVNAPRIRRSDLPRKVSTLSDTSGSCIVSTVRRRIVRNVVHS